MEQVLIRPLTKDLFIGPEEEKTLYKQGIVLFAEKSNGLKDPHPSIRQYCDLLMFWDKFGLNKFDLEKLPQPEYLRLKHIAAIEVERRQFEMRKKEVESKQK